MDKIVARARARWPRIEVQASDFAAFLAERCEPSSDALADDLYLACACAQGNVAAHAIFESRHAADIAAALSGMRLPLSVADDAKQRLRTKLFLDEGERPARIRAYSGRGSLSAWVRAVAVRTAIDLLREERSPEVPVEQAVLEVFAGAESSPEIEFLKERYRSQVNESFAHAFTTLTPRQRNLLKQHFVHGLNIDRIGAMYNVHRVTAFRWITQAKVAVYEGARAHLLPLLSEGRDELADSDDLLRLLRSQIDLSLDRLLRSEA